MVKRKKKSSLLGLILLFLVVGCGKAKTVEEAPIALDDRYNGQPNNTLNIPLNGPVAGVDGVFDNDTGGSPDEDHTLTLKESKFPLVTLQGGEVTYVGGSNTLVYTPANLFSGTDEFTYTAVDDGGLKDTATVTVKVAEQPELPFRFFLVVTFSILVWLGAFVISFISFFDFWISVICATIAAGALAFMLLT